MFYLFPNSNVAVCVFTKSLSRTTNPSDQRLLLGPQSAVIPTYSAKSDGEYAETPGTKARADYDQIILTAHNSVEL